MPESAELDQRPKLTPQGLPREPRIDFTEVDRRFMDEACADGQDGSMSMTPTQAREALERREPRMPLDQAAEWARRYRYDDDGIIDAIAASVRQRGHFQRQEFLDTYAWKTRRTIAKAETYSESEIADVTGIAFRQSDEKLRIGLLRALDGVDWPVASTLLHVGVSADYPILDYRALWFLGSQMPSWVGSSSGGPTWNAAARWLQKRG